MIFYIHGILLAPKFTVLAVAGCLEKVLPVLGRIIKQLLRFSLVSADLTGTVKRKAAVCYLMRRSGKRPCKAVPVLMNNGMVLAGLTSMKSAMPQCAI
jgi:hypothetical protein